MKPVKPDGLAERYVIPVARELAEALRWVHSVGVIHRDIKRELGSECGAGLTPIRSLERPRR